MNGASVGLAAARCPVAISGLVVTLTLVSPVVFGDDVTVSYTVRRTGTDPTPIQDLAGNSAAAFTLTLDSDQQHQPEVITPTPDTIPPEPTDAEVGLAAANAVAIGIGGDPDPRQSRC